MSQRQPPLIAQLRESIDRRHRDALRAVQTLEDYLAGTWVSEARARESSVPLGELIAYLQRNDSIRQRVQNCIIGTWKTVNEIIQETGLTKQQVRGVLYATDLRGSKIESTNDLGEKRFRIQERDAIDTNN